MKNYLILGYFNEHIRWIKEMIDCIDMIINPIKHLQDYDCCIISNELKLSSFY